MKLKYHRLILVLLSIIGIFIIDRVLLKTSKPRLWVGDPVLHFKHRPGVSLNWGEKFDNKPIKINSYGFHDNEFPEKKHEKEFRGLIIGDSIVMGHGVERNETFTNQLEKLLSENLKSYDHYQIINAGVQGYSTFQYKEVLKRTIKYSPDIIIIGFCMNDVTEPYKKNRNYGGTGDFHGVIQSSNPIIAYIFNETGFGRLAVKINQKIKKQFKSIKDLQRIETYNVRKMSKNSQKKEVYKDAWEKVLSDLSDIYNISESKEIPILLMIFPRKFQINNKEFQIPQ